MSAISKEMRFFSLVKYLTLLKRVQYIYNKFFGGGGGGVKLLGVGEVKKVIRNPLLFDHISLTSQTAVFFTFCFCCFLDRR